MNISKKEGLPTKEKPPFLYHGSPHKDVEEFEPRLSGGTGEKFGPIIYAALDLATASIFLAEVKKDWSAGRFGNVSYAIITIPREEFIKNDKGGHIYELPSDTFESDPERGLGEYEYASKEKVAPLQKIEYPSSLDAMIENGVQVYFVDEITYQKIKTSKDHGLSILQNMESENQRRGINFRPLNPVKK